MLTLHHLRIGRSLFTVWLLEELGAEYQLKEYLRDANFRAQDDLKIIHPLGKSPVLEHDGLVLAESSAITSYLLQCFDTENKFSPAPSNLAEWAKYTHWLHYPEGSVFASMSIDMLSKRDPNPSELLKKFSQAEITLHLDYIAAELADQPFILGDQLSGADFGLSFIISLAQSLGQLEGYPTLAAYLERNKARPAFQAAVAKAVE